MAVQTALMPRKKKDLGTEVVRIDADLAHMARIICAAEKTSLPEFLSRHLRPVITREFPKAAARIHKVPDMYPRAVPEDLPATSKHFRLIRTGTTRPETFA